MVSRFDGWCERRILKANASKSSCFLKGMESHYIISLNEEKD